jgi:hypothetical protein
MRLPSALLSVPGHVGPTLCYPGDLIGRLAVARLRLHDPDVSEAHALVSVRTGGLWLLALRAPWQLASEATWQVQLTPGLELPLTPGLRLQVEQTWLPDEQPALQVDGQRVWPLGWTPASLLETPIGPELVEGKLDGALAHLWPSEGEPWIRLRGSVAQPWSPGTELQIDGHTLRALLVPSAQTAWTGLHARAPRTWLRASPTRVSLRDETGRQADLTGTSAIVLYTIALWTQEHRAQTAPWLAVATALWGAKQAPSMRENLRNNVLYRLDQRLRKLGLRDDLVCRDDGLLWLADGVSVEELLTPQSHTA